MIWNATTTVLTSVFGSVVLVTALYFTHAHLLPHLQRSKLNVETTLPRSHRTAHQELRESLYSLPSLNYVDFRNSVADAELPNSRWSTSIHDLSRSASPVVKSLPQSPVTTRPVFTRGATKSTYAPSTMEDGSVASNPLHTITERRHRTSRRAKSQQLHVGTEFETWRRTGLRERSKSDSLMSVRPSLLARSHASLHGNFAKEGLPSPSTTTFTGTTLLPSPQRWNRETD